MADDDKDGEQSHGPALAFALFASTAAALAVRAIHDRGLLEDDRVGQLMTTLAACREMAGPMAPGLEEHAELLADILAGSGLGPPQADL